jgi:hypothetical protein
VKRTVSRQNPQLFAKYSGDEIREDEMGGTCSTYVGDERYVKTYDQKA